MTDLPSTWALTPLENLIAHDGVFTDGDWVESKDQDPSGSVRLIQLADIADNRFVDKSSRFLTLDKAYELNCTFLKKGDILVARMPDPLGRSCLFPLEGDQNFVTVVDVCVIRLGSVAIEPRYLMRAINSPTVRGQISDLQSGSTRKRISRGNLATVPIPIAPTNEQRRIVETIEAMFDEIDKGVESLQAARTTLGLYRQSLLKSAFEGRLTADWRAKNADKLEAPETILARIQRERDARYKAALGAWQDALATWRDSGEKGKKPAKPKRPRDFPTTASDIGIPGWAMLPLGLLIDEPAYGTSKKSDYDGGNKGVLRIPNIAAGVVDATDLKSANFDEAELEQYQLIEGDVLTIRSNGSLSLVGKPALVRPVDTEFVYAGYLIRLRPIPGSLVPKNLVYLMMGPNVRGQIESKAKSTSGVNNINAKELQELQVPICTPAEQVEIVRLLDARLDAADALETEIDAALTRADALRQSILKKAFSGQLVPQDPEDEPASALLDRIKAEKAEREKTAKRDRKSAPPRNPKARRPTLTDLIEVLEKQKSWISAAKAAQQLGIGDGSTSDDVEAFFRQLKDFVEGGAIEVERRGDEDWLRLAKVEVS
ncbi:restriction endonuclease subunit S [Rhizobium sp. NRK18]|uniref:restriction endonuclease subunit S n=1 Tax=Rhizobium sp. NRK18 TaxID=2964667 RepID=UPI0021C4731C|nr:restriction endonuclease subunit S [Rhizobium sp. NRK18]MCQ2005690.1 restriction endonuclease subunit S [Rhizobium sp. NRK18]